MSLSEHSKTEYWIRIPKDSAASATFRRRFGFAMSYAIRYLRCAMCRDSLLSRGKSNVLRRLTRHKTPQLSRLNLEHPPIRHFVAELGMCNVVIEAPKPRFPKHFPPVVGEEHTSCGVLKVFFLEGATIEQAKHHTVRDKGSKLLHEVEGERRPAIFRCVKEAPKRVEPHR